MLPAPGICPAPIRRFCFLTPFGTPLPRAFARWTKIAWIENRTATHAYLHITKWVADQGVTALPAAVTGSFLNGVCTPAGSSCDRAFDYTASTYSGCDTAFVAANGHSDLYVTIPAIPASSAPTMDFFTILRISSTLQLPRLSFLCPLMISKQPWFRHERPGLFLCSTRSSSPIPKMSTPLVNASASTLNFLPASPASYTYGNILSLYNYNWSGTAAGHV